MAEILNGRIVENTAPVQNNQNNPPMKRPQSRPSTGQKKILQQQQQNMQQPIQQGQQQIIESFNQINGDLQNKIDLLEQKLQRENRNKDDLREKLILTEQNQKEILFFMRNFQKAETSEIMQLRTMLQERITEESTTLQKEREKSKALFMEVVRLGETQERVSETQSNLQAQFETRIALLESQLNAGQKSVTQLAQKGDLGLNFINEWNEKLEKRTQQLEANMLNVNKEILKDRDQLSTLEDYNQKVQNDIKSILRTIQNDYDNKLELRVTEIVNRIVMEHEERLRQNEEIKTNIEIRDKLNNEKHQYEKEEMRERYSGLDALVRTEFQRKDEALRSLQSIFENQVKGLQNALRFEEQSRIQQEGEFRNEILKMQELFQREYDIFKNQQSNITEKITEMMKIEIQTRLNSDVDLKNLTSAIATDIVSDVNNVKDQMEVQQKKIQEQLKESRLESASRSEQLSRYIDEEVKKVVEIFAKKHEKTKLMFTKLAEQFKNHLINTDINRKEQEKRILSLEKLQEDSRTETYKLIGDTQKAFDNRLQEEKRNLEIHIDTIASALQDRIVQMSDEEKKDVEFLKEAIDNTREMVNNRVNNVQNQLVQFQQLHEEQVNQISDKIDILKENLSDHIEQNKFKIQQIEDTIQENQTALKKNINQVELLLKENIQQIQNQLNDLEQKFENLKNSFTKDLNETKENMKNMNKEVTSSLNEFSLLIQTNLQQLVETIDMINNIYNNLEEKINSIKSEQILEKTMAQVQGQIQIQERNDLFELMNELNNNMKVSNKHYENEISDVVNQMNTLKTKLLQDLNENYDRKLQKLLENIKQENQEMWQKNVQIVNSDFKNFENLKNNNNVVSQLNEILITQDEYNKPKFAKD